MNIPKHIAIIMDGNGRWAKKRMLPRSAGHRKGAQQSEKIAKYCKQIGVKYLTLYAFSTENWQRPKEEVNSIMDLFRNYLDNDVEKLVNDGVKLKFLGNRKGVSQDILDKMDRCENISKNNPFCLNIAFNYGGRDEIKNAAFQVAKKFKNGNLNTQEDLEADFESIMSIGDADPDLFIRTGGDVRLSNFLLWQIAYTELYFSKKMWPNFGTQDIDDAIKDFNERERKFGK